MTLKDVRSNRFLADIDVNPKNVEDSFRTHDRNVQDLDARVDIVNETLVAMGRIIDGLGVSASAEMQSINTVIKKFNLKMRRLNERY